MEQYEVRSVIPSEVVYLFDDIVNGTALGASNHIKMIAQMFVAISKTYGNSDGMANIMTVSQFFKQTRGNSSYAIVTALEQIEDLIKSEEGDLNVAVKSAVDKYFEISEANNQKIFNYTDRLLKNVDTVLLFDYSSTVEKSIVNCSHKLTVYIPESRVISGGFPFVNNVVNAGHYVHFIPDASMLSVLNKIEIVFIGAETFYPDGTAFNTIGSDILAELCYLHHVPYYVLTPLLKNDIRALYGVYKPVLTKDMKEVLAKEWATSLKDNVDFNSIELVSIPPELITGYVTEKGILKPTALINFVYKEEK